MASGTSVGFETAVNVVVFIHKLKLAVERSHMRSATVVGETSCAKSTISPDASTSAAVKPRTRQVGFETAVTAVIFTHKLKVAVARSRMRSAHSFAKSTASPDVNASFTLKPKKRQVGFETAVTAVIFAHKLKAAVARSHMRSAAIIGETVGHSYAKSIVSPDASTSLALETRKRQVGFETAVAAVIFTHKLKVAVARSRVRSAAIVRPCARSVSVRGDNANIACLMVTVGGLHQGRPIATC